jgi:hypothetical protein
MAIKKFQWDVENTHQKATVVRPALPQDRTRDGRPTWSPGELPQGGYQPIWTFQGGNSKDAPTTANYTKNKVRKFNGGKM